MNKREEMSPRQMGELILHALLMDLTRRLERSGRQDVCTRKILANCYNWAYLRGVIRLGGSVLFLDDAMSDYLPDDQWVDIRNAYEGDLLRLAYHQISEEQRANDRREYHSPIDWIHYILNEL